jgi:hypothetical protein
MASDDFSLAIFQEEKMKNYKKPVISTAFLLFSYLICRFVFYGNGQLTSYELYIVFPMFFVIIFRSFYENDKIINNVSGSHANDRLEDQ